MISKPSAVLDAAYESPIVAHQSKAPTVARQGGSFWPTGEEGAPLDLDSYQIALLTLPARKGGSPPQNGGLGQFLLLPLTWNQLIAQVRREMAHSSITKESQFLRFGQIRVDLLAMEVCRSDRPVSLTAMEFKVLRFFVSNPNRVIPRDDMLNQVWGYENYPCTRTVDNHVLRLRQKLELEPTHPVHFRTIHGMGYKFIP